MAEYDSPFKPIVSDSDYLSGSEFGQVAGALLSRRDKQDKKQARKALVASAVLETFGTLQRNQKQGVIDAINDTNEKYSDVFEGNKEYFNDESISQQRKLYQLYKNEKTRDRALLTQAINTFNTDTDIIAAYGPNAFTTVSQMKKTKGGAIALSDEIELLKAQAKDYFESITDEAITMPTFTKYNAKAKNAYQAAIEEIKNDPTKKGLVRAAWLKVFGRDKDGNPRFGLVHQDKLTNARETAEINAGLVTDIDTKRVENIYKDIETQEKLETEKRSIPTDFGKVVDNKGGDKTLNNILLDAVNKKKKNDAFLNEDEYTFKINEKEQTGTVYNYYRKLNTSEKLDFLENIVTRATFKKINYYDTDTTGNFISDTRFLQESLSDYFQETITTDNPNNFQFNETGTKLFDLEEPINITLGGQNVTTKIGSLAELLKTETKDNAFQIIADISNSLDNPAVINYFQSIYNKQFATDSKDSDFDSFFKYETTFRTNPLSLPE